MRRPLNLFLVGPMGAGKSTIGKQLAEELRLEFFDTDQVIEERTGADISWIFDVEGEEGFRKREAKVIDELTQMRSIVLATGGGAIITPENRNRLAARGTVVYLKTSLSQQMERTNRDKRRPLIQNGGASDDKEAELKELMLERGPMYEEISDVVVETDGRTVRSVSAEVIKSLDSEE